MAPAAEGDGVVADQRGHVEMLSSTRLGANTVASALGHGPAHGEITMLPTSTGGEMRCHRRRTTAWRMLAIMGGDRVEWRARRQAAWVARGARHHGCRRMRNVRCSDGVMDQDRGWSGFVFYFLPLLADMQVRHVRVYGCD